MTIKTILVCVSGAESGRLVLDAAARIAAMFGSHVEALHVRADPRGLVPYTGEGMDGSMIEEIMDVTEREGGDRALKTKTMFDQFCAERSLRRSDAPAASAEEERDQNRLQRLHQGVERVLDFLNHELSTQQFLAGEFSVAEIGFAPRLLVLKDLGIDAAANNRANVDGWIKRMLERPSIRGLEGLVADPVAAG